MRRKGGREGEREGGLVGRERGVREREREGERERRGDEGERERGGGQNLSTLTNWNACILHFTCITYTYMYITT